MNTKLSFLLIALLLACFGLLPKAQAVSPAPDGGYPGGNTAEGQSALLSRTTGGFNTANGWLSLRSNMTGNFNTAIGAGTLLANTADGNTATGAVALLQPHYGIAQSRARTGKLQGHVTDAQSGKALVGATVIWSRGTDTRAVQGATDAVGRYAFAVPIVGGVTQNTITLSIRANAHAPQQESVVVHSGERTQANALLSPVPSSRIGTVKGTVTNKETGHGIHGAKVSILNAGAVLKATTNSAGAYTISGVGFHTGLRIRMITPGEADTPRPIPCLVPMQRTFNMNNAMVIENFASSPAMTYSPTCPTTVAGPGPGVPSENGAASTALASDSTLNWRQADTLSIQIDANNDAWNSGHINSMLKLSTGGFLVGSDTGGVWLLTSILQGISVSFTWDSVNITSLAFGLTGEPDVYAATRYGGEAPDPDAHTPAVLWETDTSTGFPLLNWSHVNPSPPCGSINQVVVVPEANKIVVACDNGLWWSPIPPSPSVHGTYNWSKAHLSSGTPPLPSTNFSGLAKAFAIAGNSPGAIVASLHGGKTPNQIIYTGEWVSGNLLLTGAAVSGQVGSFGRTTLASCPADPRSQYAIAADGNDDNLGGVWHSSDNGHSWAEVTVPNNAGNMGWYNQTLAVSPADCNTFVLGFRNGSPANPGPLVSFNGGTSYTGLSDGGQGHQHSDIHALLFDPADANTLYVGSDGGMLAVHNLSSSPTFQSNFNRELLDLQVYHGVGSTQVNGLVGSSLQDNGSNDALLMPFGAGSWEQQMDSDGSYSEFVTPNSLPAGQDIFIRAESCCGGANWSSALWNGTQFDSGQVIPVATSQNPRDPNGIPRCPEARIRFPRFLNSIGQTMYAVAGLAHTVYGLFANDDGSDMHWEQIGLISATDNVTSLSSFYGNIVFVGTDQGNIFELDQPYNAAATLLQVNSPTGSPAQVTGIVEYVSTIGFATLDSGYVLDWKGQTWDALGGGTLPTSQPFRAVVLPTLKNLIAITPASVFISHDLGTTWATANNGLPLIPQGTDLRFVLQANGTGFIYMATFGRSLWRSVLR
jgi:hypothetical protein